LLSTEKKRPGPSAAHHTEVGPEGKALELKSDCRVALQNPWYFWGSRKVAGLARQMEARFDFG